jgi:autotransporter-associated beta strand protein
MKPKSSLRSFLALGGSTLLVVSSVNATQFWDGTGGDAYWNTAANWGGDALPAFGTTAINFGSLSSAAGTAFGNVVVPAQTTATNNLAANSTVKGISFGNTGAANRTQAFILDGAAITLGTGTNDGIFTTAITTGNPAIEDLLKLNIYLPTAGQVRQFSTGLNHNLKVDGVISGLSNLYKAGVGNLTLTSAANSYTGFTNIQDGVLEITSIANGGLNSSIGASSSASTNLQFGFAVNSTTAKTLRYTGSSNGSTDRAFQIGGNTTLGTHSYIESSGIGTLSFTSSSAITYTNINTSPRNLYLGGTNTGGNSFNLALGNNGTAVTTFTKQGAGKWIISGANTYTGATKIEGGTLQFAKQVSLYNNNTAGTGWTAANIKVAGTATLALNVGGAGEFTTGNVTTLLTNLGGADGTSTTGFGAGSAIGFDTTNAGGSFTVGDVIADSTGTGGGAIGLIKLGTGALVLSNTNTYSGATIVSAGTLLVTGALSNSATTVQAAGMIGSGGATGTLGNGLTIAASGNLDLTGATLGLSSTNILSLTGGILTLGNLTFLDLVGWDWANAAVGSYELIDGSFTVDFGNTAYLSEGTAYDFGNGRKGYFTSGSLNAVIVPEPRAALLGGLGLLALLRRRRA